ncbi:ester cyclase [Pyxidicoccus parkwayensis]|uniref:Ester cyclase n=1 Tax=Pyxidicoccus parkwayensis TaxID=2813578 RepID=A0ABX7NZK7_9BACT|nr:ester cyclase family protein [Pyxidicoccus parkwaysis]QSQ22885.1 ester cyclase [Pyxidicoccus parkwaysis]
MSEENKAIVRRFYEEVMNHGRVDVLDEIMTPDFKDHGETLLGSPTGREVLKQGITGTRQILEGLTVHLHQIHAEGNLVGVRGRMSCVHRGTFFGVPGTGNALSWAGLAMFRIQEGRIAERWFNSDSLSIVQQLGITTPLAQAAPVTGAPARSSSEGSLPAPDAASRTRASASIEDVRRLAVALGDPDATVLSRTLDELLAPGFVLHGEAGSPRVMGRESLERVLLSFKEAFTDVEVTLEASVTEGNAVMAHLRLGCIQRREWMGSPVTGKPLTWTLTLLAVRSGEGLSEGWMLQDRLGLFEQLGLMPHIPGQGG